MDGSNNFPATQRTGLTGTAVVRLDWTIFDGGARKNNLLKAEANRNAAAAKAEVTMDQIADEVWRWHRPEPLMLRHARRSLTPWPIWLFERVT
jgi:hypothetical protein